MQAPPPIHVRPLPQEPRYLNWERTLPEAPDLAALITSEPLRSWQWTLLQALCRRAGIQMDIECTPRRRWAWMRLLRWFPPLPTWALLRVTWRYAGITWQLRTTLPDPEFARRAIASLAITTMARTPEEAQARIDEMFRPHL